MCHGGLMSPPCRASPPSACSRRWPAASPLVSAPWDDAEQLFRPGTDYLVAANGAAMTEHLPSVAERSALRAALAAAGWRRSTPAIPAPTASTSCSISSPMLDAARPACERNVA